MSELRWASVLFVDLVSSTSLTEGRDAEDVRDLLSGYFEVADMIVERYGGTARSSSVTLSWRWGCHDVPRGRLSRCVRNGP